ncbi:MAG: 50S ribosomal protein L10 [Acidimicrobiales bacterium]
MIEEVMRMENPRPEKVAVVEEVRARLGAADAAILTEYRGLTVKDMAALRRSLTEAGGTYKVYKNTLVRFAARDLGLDELEAMLQGPTAIAFVAGDAVDVAKALRDFARAHPALVVKGGVLGTKVLSSADAAALADVAPREVLLARFAAALAAPMVQLAGLLQALPRNFAYGLKALIDKGGAADAPAHEAAGAAPAEGAPAEPAASDEPATPPSTEDPAEGAPEPGEPSPPSSTTEAAEVAPGDTPSATTENP